MKVQVYICMPLSNRGVRYCHTNIDGCSFNGAFNLYTTVILRKFFGVQNNNLFII